MRKIISLICITLFVALYSCDERDDLRSDIDNLKERVANLEASIKQMNSDISNYQQMVEKTILVVGFSKDEQDNYTIELSNGETVTVYSGQVNMDDMPLFSINALGHWAYTINGMTTEVLISDQPVNAIPETGEAGITPQLKVDANGFWLISMDGSTWEKLGNNQIADGAQIVASKSSIFSNVAINEATGIITFTIRADNSTVEVPIYGKDFHLTIKFDGTATFGLGQKQVFEVEQANVATATIENQTWGVVLLESQLIVTAPKTNVRGEAYDDVIHIKIFSKEGYCRVVKLPVRLLTTAVNANATTAWNEFIGGDEKNVLLDFSYAGYMHGESAPPETTTLVAQGYKVYDVTEYGAIPNDGKSDREAFMKVLAKIAGTNNIKQEDNGMTDRYIKENAKAIIYFPDGNFILQDADSKNRKIRMSMGNIVLKGAGRNKTTLEMTVANNSPQPTTQMWNSPVMMEFKHNSGWSELGSVTENASIGSKTVTTSASGLSSGNWVCLVLENKDEEVINQELSPYRWQDINVPSGGGSLNIHSEGIQIYEYHQIDKVNGSKITFKEPIMHAINKDWGWKIAKYPNYANVGVEDLTFKGHAKEKFIHHGSDIDDGGFKLIDFVRLTNSWIRRVNFESVSEAMSITSSANCSAYDIQIGGNRGHAAIRSQASTRIFIGKVTENSDGYTLSKGEGEGTLGSYKTNVGQYHACGVSKQSMGAVIWNVKWGDDSCFEAHATQPRATLIDCCSGGFMHWRQGGDSAQMPNHMENLTIWNFNATNIQTDSSIDSGGKFSWWDPSGYWWKFMPPTVVGFHGVQALTFEESQMKRLEGNGSPVEPYSLYEAQLQARLGYVPGWLNAIK